MLWLDAPLSELAVKLTGGPRTLDPEFAASEVKKAENHVQRYLETLRSLRAQAQAEYDREKADYDSAKELEAQDPSRVVRVQEYLNHKQKKLDRAIANVEELERWELGPAPEMPQTTVLQKTWEQPVVDPKFVNGSRLEKGGYVAGFVDMDAWFKVPDLYVTEGYVRSEWSLPKWYLSIDKRRFVFEVKTTIPSLSELVRQIRFYESKLPAGTKFVVVSPGNDSRLVDALVSQGIIYVSHPNGWTSVGNS